MEVFLTDIYCPWVQTNQNLVKNSEGLPSVLMERSGDEYPKDQELQVM